MTSHSSLMTTLQSVITMAERAVISSEEATAAARLASIHANSALAAAKLALREVERTQARPGLRRPEIDRSSEAVDEVDNRDVGAVGGGGENEQFDAYDRKWKDFIDIYNYHGPDFEIIA